MPNRNTVLTLVAIVALSGVLVLRVQSLFFETDDGDRTAATSDQTDPEASDPEEVEIGHRSYETGDCVIWDQGGGQVRARVVDCAEPHLVEMIDSALVSHGPEEPFPSEAEWDAVFDQLCLPLIDDYLDGKLDPYGRFGPGGIQPTEEGWAEGSRVIWCGLIERTERSPNQLAEFTGRVAESDQSWLYPLAACLELNEASLETVECSQPHHYVVAGHLDLSDLADRPSDDDLWGRCDELHPPADPATNLVTFAGFDSESWAAGSRRGTCLHGTDDGSGMPVLRTP